VTTQVRVSMPGDPPPRARGWAIASVPVAVFAMLAVLELPLEARSPNGYIASHMHDGGWTYPLDEVVGLMAAICGETLLAIGWLASRRSKPTLGGRALWISVSMNAVWFIIAPWAMRVDHMLAGVLTWQLLAAEWLFVVSLGYGVIARVGRFRERTGPNRALI
jgi:hypothetical protein